MTEAPPLDGRFHKDQFIQQRTNEHPCLDARLLMDRYACLFGLRTVKTQCTETVRIIAPSHMIGKESSSTRKHEIRRTIHKLNQLLFYWNTDFAYIIRCCWIARQIILNIVIRNQLILCCWKPFIINPIPHCLNSIR